MHRKKVAIAALALLAGACAVPNTQVVQSWRDPEIGRVSFTHVLAVAMVKNEARRRTIEDRMVADIKHYGVDATPSYRLIATADTRNDDVIKAAMAKGGFDGAVTWRTISASNETHYVPGTVSAVPVAYSGFYGYYHVGWDTVYDPGYLQTDRVVRVETMVYALNAASDKLIWTGTSETVDPNSLDNLVDGVADATIETMRRENLFKKR